MSDLFISYSRKDKEFVHRLFDALIARQRDVWVDWEDIPPTADWRAEIYSAIESAQNFLFVLSPDSVASQVCGEELAHAIQTNKRLIPIFCRDVDSKSVNPELGKLNWIYFRATDDFDRAVESLNTALDTDLAWVKAHTRLLTRAVEWENKKRDDSLVLRGRDLREAEEAQAKSAAKEPKLTPLQSEYILASRKSENRRQRIIRGAVTIGFIAMSILAIFAFIQRNQAIAERNLAQSRELAAATLGNLESDRELGLLLALEALRIMPTFEAEDALRQALQASYNRIDLDGFGGSAVQALFSPDAKSVLTVSNDGTTQLWSASRKHSAISGSKHRKRDCYFRWPHPAPN